LVEDNITNQKVALGILQKLGLKADAVANGAEAVKTLESIPYDLVLMDVQMPVMDGMEATRHIRDQQSAVLNHQLPIIAMTAHALLGDRERCLEAGMNDYVSKPVDPQALAEAIEHWLSGKTRNNPPPEITEIAPPEVQPKVVQIPVFDKVSLMQRLMDDEDLAHAVIAAFIEDIPDQIRALKNYLKTEDISGAERQAHTIKGAAANIGGEALRAVAFEMEKNGNNGDLPAIQAHMGELEMQFELLREALNKEMRDSQNS